MSTQNPTSTETRDDAPVVHHWTHDYTVVPLDGDCWEIIDLVTDARAASYCDGRTTDVLLTGAKGDDTADKHVTGVAGEVATAMALGIPVLEALDLTVSPKGDDGVDLVVRDGPFDQTSIDIKTYWGSPTGSPPQLLVEKGKAENGPAEAFVKAQVWDSNWAVIHGWTTRERLLDEGWVEGPPRWEQQNWTMTADMLDPIETLDAETVGWQW
jgi:hypothetical protein